MFEAFLRWLKRHKFELYWTLSEMFPYRNKESKTVHLGRNVPVRCIRCGESAGPNRYACRSCYEDMLAEAE